MGARMENPRGGGGKRFIPRCLVQGIEIMSVRSSVLAATVAIALGNPAPAFAEGVAINAADTAWMISATGLVLMMSIPGLALFYCGMVRKKNVLATMAQTLACTFICSILWASV